MLKPFVAASIVSLGFLAACSSSDDGDSNATTPPTETPMAEVRAADPPSTRGRHRKAARRNTERTTRNRSISTTSSQVKRTPSRGCAASARTRRGATREATRRKRARPRRTACLCVQEGLPGDGRRPHDGANRARRGEYRRGSDAERVCDAEPQHGGCQRQSPRRLRIHVHEQVHRRRN